MHASRPASQDRAASPPLFIRPSQSRHAKPADHERLTQVFLDHMGRDAQSLRDLLVAQAVPVRHLDRGALLRRKPTQHAPQFLGAPCALNLRTKAGHLGQFRLDTRLFDINRKLCRALLECVLVGKIACDRRQVSLWVANCAAGVKRTKRTQLMSQRPSCIQGDRRAGNPGPRRS